MDDVAAAASERLMTEKARCPHCGALTAHERSDAWHFVCAACGGVRAPGDADADDELKGALATVQGDRVRAAKWRLVTMITAGAAVLVAALGLLAADVHVALAPLLVVVSLVALGLSIWSTMRGASSRRDARTSHTIAWQHVAMRHLERESAAQTTHELARALAISEPEAERLVTLLAVDDRVSATSDGRGEIFYAPIASKVRVPEDASAPVAAEADNDDAPAADALDADAATQAHEAGGPRA